MAYGDGYAGGYAGGGAGNDGAAVPLILLRRRGAMFISPFTPLSLGAKLTGWWSADSLGLNDGDLVASWSDRSPGSHALTASGFDRPTFIVSVINGKPVVRYNAAAQNRTKTTSFNLAPTAGRWTVWAVARQTGGAAIQAVVSQDNSQSGSGNRIGQFIYYMNDGTVRTIAFNSTFGTAFADSETLTASSFHVLEAHVTSSLVEATVDGASNGTTAVTSALANAAQILAVGCASDLSVPLTGDIAEVVCAEETTATDRLNVRNYLYTEYALSGS